MTEDSRGRLDDPTDDEPDPLLEVSTDVNVPPERVWALVTDLPRMAEWSPQVVKSAVAGGKPVRRGSRLVNLNRKGFVFWPTTAKVISYEQGRRIAFRVEQNWSVWSFELAPDGAGRTTVTERRELPNGLSGFSRMFVRRVFGNQKRFSAAMTEGMAQTLQRVKTEAEGGPQSRQPEG